MKRLIIITLVLIWTVNVPAAVPEHIGKPYFQNITALEYNGHNRNFDIQCDRTGRVFVANFEGLAIGDGTGWRMIHSPGISRITDLFMTDKGQIWVGGYNILGYLDEQDEIRFIVSDADTASRFGEIRNIRTDSRGIAFDTDNGVFCYSKGNIMKTPDIIQPEVKSDDINCSIDIPDQGVTASATVSSGVIFYDRDGNELYRVCADDGLCSDNVSALSYDGKGTVWGTSDNGIFRISISPVITQFSHTDGLSGQVCSILCSGKKLFAGTLQGLFIKNEYERYFKRCEGLDLACWQLLESPDGKVYIAATQGLYVYGKTLKRLTSRHTLSIARLSDGSLITGEVDGMYIVFPDGRDKKLNDIPSVLKLSVDSDGGIMAMNNYEQSFYSTGPDEMFRLVEGEIWSLLPEYFDDNGGRWHTGLYGDGVICDGLSPRESEWLKMFDNSTIDAICIAGSSAFFGGNFGLVRMDLEGSKNFKPYSPNTYFRSVNIDRSSLSCSFSADKIDPTGQIFYSYKIREDGGWSDWNSANTLSFDHIQSGEYALSVRCKDSFGNISIAGPVWFVVHPPIYLRWYAIFVYVILAVVLAMTYQQLRTLKLKQNEERLEGIVAERTSELREAQKKLLSQEREATVGKLTRGLIDRILNPMNYITNFSRLSKELASDLKQDITEEKERIKQETFDDCTDILDMLSTNLDKIEQHGMSASRILKSMEELLQDRQAKIELTDMVIVCRETCISFEETNREKIAANGIILEWNYPEESIPATADKTNLAKALTSLLANSLFAVLKKCTKSTVTDPKISLSLEKGTDGKGCIIRIRDNGVGIESTIMDKIFDPFFTTKTTSEASGTGLYVCRQVIQDMGGTIGMDSEKDIYTEVTITLPN